MRKPSPAMLVALAALFVALGGVGVAANGGNLVLGQSNSATSQTSLSAPVTGGKTVQLTNNDSSKGNSTALGLNVASGHVPFTVNSSARVQNLNADKVDGLDASAFQLNSNRTRLDAVLLNTGATKSWDIGPYISLIAQCTHDSTSNQILDVSLLNNSPTSGEWQAGNIVQFLNGSTALETGGGINSGHAGVVTHVQYPNPDNRGELEVVTLVWTDGSGETVTGTYWASAIGITDRCSLYGTLTRTT